MGKGITIVVVMVLAASPGLTATSDDFDLELVKAGTPGQYLIFRQAHGVTTDMSVLLTTRAGGTQGWSLGVGLDADPAVSTAITSIWLHEVRIDQIQDPTTFSLYWYTQDDPPQQMGPYSYLDLPITGIEAGSFLLTETVDMMNPLQILPATDDLNLISFTVSADADLAQDETAEIQLEFTDDFGSTPFATVVVNQGISVAPAVQNPATITLTGQPPFRRGDINDDGHVDIADPLFFLQSLIPCSGCPSYRCLDAADANDDERLDIADPIYILQFLFTSGPWMPPPYPGCGIDTTPSTHSGPNPDLVECEYTSC
jgi:hypothetical protein